MQQTITKKGVTDLSYKILGHAITVHKTLGPGLLESVYEKCLKHELIKNGYDVKQQVRVPIIYDTLTIDADLKIDLLVNDLIIIELKAIENTLPIHEAQLLTYMRLLKKPQGILINFNVTNITKSTRPLVNQYFSQLPP